MKDRLRDLLEQAAEAVAEVDRERGNVDRDGDPTGDGEMLAGIAMKVRDEAFAPTGRD